VLHWAARGRARGGAAAVGEPLELFLPNAAGGAEAVVEVPDGRTETTRTQPADEASVLRWADTDLSGVYQAVVGGGPREHPFAVNVPAAAESQQGSESNLARTSREELQRGYPARDVQAVRDPTT